MLKTRILTALIAIPLLALILFGGKVLFILGWTGLTLIAAQEWMKLTRHTQDRGDTTVRLVEMAWRLLALASFMYAAPGWGRVFLWLIGLPALFFWLRVVPGQLKRYAEDGHLDVSSILWPWVHLLVFDAFVLAGAFLYVKLGSAALLGLLVIIWAADTGAYTAGRLFGKHPFAPAISPKKTREGFIGGCVTAMLAALIYLAIFDISMPGWLFIPLSAGVVAFAAVGDLWESALKRAADVKDSGKCLPGHGGMFDRIDSWLPSLLFWALAFSLFV